MSTGRIRFGIGGRLGLAFAVSAALAIVACIIGWLSYERLSLSMQQISRDDLPAAISATRLTQLGSAIIGTAPVLSQAETAESVARIDRQIAGRLAEMRDILDATESDELSPVRKLMGPLAENLAQIRAETLSAITMRGRNEAFLREIMALHSDFVDEAEPLVDDARFIAQSLLEDIGQRGGNARTASEITQQTKKAEAILQLSSHANLAIGLISRIASVSTQEHLAIDGHFLAETLDFVRPLLPSLDSASDTISLRQIVARLFEIADPENGLPGLRRLELKQRDRMNALVSSNREMIAELDRALAGVLEAAKQRASASGRAAEKSIQIGRNALLLIAIGAVVASLIAGFLYVRSNLIRRIRSISNAARLLADGRMPGPIAITGSDELTDMARAMERFRHAQEELVQAAKLAALGNLSAGIAHEINQPLNAIRAHAHNALICQQRGDSAGLTRALRKVDSLIARTAQIITHLRRFARRSEVALSPVSLLDAVEGAIVLLGPHIRNADANVSCKVAPDIRVLAEDIRLEQVVVNLLANAVDAVARQERRDVQIRAETAGGLVRLHMIDSGPGIPAELAASLFDPFVSSKPAGSGMGLGLSISYNIMRDFGGALRVIDYKFGAHFLMELKDAAGGMANDAAAATDRR
ncbi:MAG: HAMP domain-containing protein [Proteobacteria bacterium]|nr:HAMP domain-containing protein [Pseudomonadota bacterium]